MDCHPGRCGVTESFQDPRDMTTNESYLSGLRNSKAHGDDFRVEGPYGPRSCSRTVFGRAQANCCGCTGRVLCRGRSTDARNNPLSSRSPGNARSVPFRTWRQTFFGSMASAFPVSRNARATFAASPDGLAVALDGDDDWLQVRVFAHTAGDEWKPGIPVESPAVLFEYGPESRWEKVSAGGRNPEALERIDEAAADAPTPEPGDRVGARNDAPLPPEDIWLEEPDAERTTAVLDWVARTGAKPGLRAGSGTQPGAADRGLVWWCRHGPAHDRRAGRSRLPTAPFDALMVSATRRSRLVRLCRGAANSGLVHVMRAGSTARGLGRVVERIPRLSDAEIARLRSATAPWVKLRSGWVRRDTFEVADRTSACLPTWVWSWEGASAVTLWQLAQARPESLDELERVASTGTRSRRFDACGKNLAEFRGLPRIPVPPASACELRPYQRQGPRFLATEHARTRRDPGRRHGLGNTVQTLACSSTSDRRRPDRAVAGRGPTSVMGNWSAKPPFSRPSCACSRSARAERHALRRELSRFDLVVTDYALLRRDLEAWKRSSCSLWCSTRPERQEPRCRRHRCRACAERPASLALTGHARESARYDLWAS